MTTIYEKLLILLTNDMFFGNVIFACYYCVHILYQTTCKKKVNKKQKNYIGTHVNSEVHYSA